MPDPLELLRCSVQPVEPRPDFTRELMDRISAGLRADTVTTHTRRSEPTMTVLESTGLDFPGLDSAVLDDALASIAGTGPEFDPFGVGFCLSNHVPMVAEALCAIGRPDAVPPYVAHYAKYLEPASAARVEIDDDSWTDALGDLGRDADWVRRFDAELAEAKWDEVLDRWVPRLAPATVAVHGLLRVAHAARSLGARNTPLRRHELAEALAYWASTYETLPDTPGPPRDLPRDLRPSEALPLVEQPDLRVRTEWMQFTQPVSAAAALPSFAQVIDLVDVDGDPSEFLSDLTEAYAALLVTNASTGRSSRGILHGFTAGSAARMMLPYLSRESTACALRYGWQVAAAFAAGLGVEPPATDVVAPGSTIDQLIDEAIACPDEHGIKITEACLREYRVNPKPVYLAAAQAVTRDLAVRGLKLT